MSGNCFLNDCPPKKNISSAEGGRGGGGREGKTHVTL